MSDKQETFDHLLTQFDEAMLVTSNPDGSLQARPMHIAEVDASHDLWFATQLNSGKVRDIQQDASVAVVMQGRSKYLSISGKAEVVRDPGKVEALWKESWRAWFKDGPSDQTLGLVRVKTTSAEYWDASGVAGVRYVAEAAKSVLLGSKAPEPDENTFGHVQL